MSHPGDALSAYLDGELSRDDERHVLAHLADCEGCRAELAELDQARSAIRSLPVLDSPVALDVPALRPGRFRRVARSARAAAAAVILVAAAGAVGLVRGAPQSDSVDLGSVIDQHTARVSVDPGMTPVKGIAGVGRQ